VTDQCELCGHDDCEGVCGCPGCSGDPSDHCVHEWFYTGTAYGGDDQRFGGEGRVYCCLCGADGDA